MFKKISKFLLLFLLIFVVSSSSIMCLADEPTETTNTTSETNEETNSTDEATNQEIHSGDLYLFDNNIVMDKLVDGNVFIFGNNVEITGQVNGSLFVFANTVKFNNSYVVYDIFACANSIYYNGRCDDNLYVASNNIDMAYNGIVYRDTKIFALNATIKSAIGRDVDVICGKIDLGSGTDVPLIYGNLRYSSYSEITIPENVIAGDGSAIYTKLSALNSTSSSIPNILIGFATCIVTAFAIYIIINKLTPKFAEKISNEKFSALKLLKAFGIGLAFILVVLIFFILLLGTAVGSKLAFILALLFAILYLASVPILAIAITNALKPALKIEKTSMFYLILGLISIILYGFTFIPYVGGLLGLIINIIAIGLLVNMYLPHKELTEEEKTIIEEAKKQAKENKEKRKQEKIDAKAAKKQEKLETKKKENKDKTKKGS